MAEVWAVIVSIILILIIIAMINSSREKSRNRKITERYIKETDDFVRSGEVYTVVLSDGRRFEDVTLVGYSKFNDNTLGANSYAPGHWMIMESNSKRIFVRPSAIRYYEENKK
jgi:hypothetical protein